MGIDSVTDFKKQLPLHDRLWKKPRDRGSYAREAEHFGRYWMVNGKDDLKNSVYQDPHCISVLVDCELFVRMLWKDDIPVPLSALVRRLFDLTVLPFIDAQNELCKLLVLSFDNSGKKLGNKIATQQKRAETVKDHVASDSEIPSMMDADTVIPSVRGVLANPKFKAVLYNALVHGMAQRCRDLAVMSDYCGVVLLAPYYPHEAFPIQDLPVFEPGETVGDAFCMTGRHYNLTLNSEFDLSTLEKDYPYSEGDVLLRVYSDYVQAQLKEILREEGFYIAACTKDSDSLAFFTLAHPGRVVLGLGTVADEWLLAAPGEKVSAPRGSSTSAFFLFVERLYIGLGLDNACNAATFGFALAMSGTDYVDRPAGIGAESIFKTMCEWVNLDGTPETSMGAVLRFAPGIFEEVGKRVVFDPAHAVSVISRGWRRRTSACTDFAEAHSYCFLQALWNVHYWMMMDASRGGPDPLKYGWRREVEGEAKGLWAIRDARPQAYTVQPVVRSSSTSPAGKPAPASAGKPAPTFLLQQAKAKAAAAPRPSAPKPSATKPSTPKAHVPLPPARNPHPIDEVMGWSDESAPPSPGGGRDSPPLPKSQQVSSAAVRKALAAGVRQAVKPAARAEATVVSSDDDAWGAEEEELLRKASEKIAREIARERKARLLEEQKRVMEEDEVDEGDLAAMEHDAAWKGKGKARVEESSEQRMFAQFQQAQAGRRLETAPIVHKRPSQPAQPAPKSASTSSSKSTGTWLSKPTKPAQQPTPTKGKKAHPTSLPPPSKKTHPTSTGSMSGSSSILNLFSV